MLCTRVVVRCVGRPWGSHSRSGMGVRSRAEEAKGEIGDGDGAEDEDDGEDLYCVPSVKIHMMAEVKGL